MKADLHIHSTVSDGSDSIEQLITLAELKELDAIAITDHDTCAHLPLIDQLHPRPNLRVLAGVEISALHIEKRKRAHILGYHIKKTEPITALTQPLLEARNSNSEKQVECLQQLGYTIDIDELPRADGKYLYKQHIMDWLVSTDQAEEMFGNFFYDTFKRGGPCDIDIEYIDVLDAVHAIKEAGGLAVLAHPGNQQNFHIIGELAAEGLDGVELNHHTHSEEDREVIRSYAEQYGLFLTGGSDYHGRYEPHSYTIGDFLSEPSGIEAIVARRDGFDSWGRFS